VIENLSTEYDSNNLNIKYHDDIEDITAQSGLYDTSFSTMKVLDKSGNVIVMPFAPGQGLSTYNEPGTYLYGPTTYVPNYEDSIYLSKTTRLSTTGNVNIINNKTMSGFCSNLQFNSVDLELKCNSIPKDECASTSCCTLLGGTKCVSGNINGPTMTTNYSDYTIPNKDFYYYQGKCYGNCKS